MISFSSESAEYSVVVLPEPVGPVTRHDAVGLVHHAAKALHRLVVHADLVQVQRDDRTVQHPHHDALAKHRRQHADAQVDRVSPDGQFNPAVLRQPPFGNVEVGHHLDAGRDRKCQVTRRGYQFVQHAVGFDADAELILERLEVNVAGVFLDRRQQHDVQQLADRRTVGHRFDTRQLDRPVLDQRLGRLGQFGVGRRCR